MICQGALPFPSTPSILPVLGRPEADAPAIRSHGLPQTAPSGSREVEYFDLPIRDILNRCSSERMPFVWTINPYRGCEFACTYCYARYTHGFFDLERWQDFETKIFVKREAAAALEKRLRKAALQGEPIAIGTATDPYQPAEAHHRVTRSLLEVFRKAEGLDLSITTKSPLVTRDLDLLTELDHRHRVRVNLTVTTTDSRLARKLEPQAPDPRARLRAMEALTEAGIETHLYVMPMLPGINSGEAPLRELFQAALNGGASDVAAAPLFLRAAARARFWPWLKEQFPKLVPLYERLYGRRDYLSTSQSEALKADYRRLKLEYGFPLARAARS
jgi:DNA repair photolyase